jgi:hypothetical protein
MVLNSMNGYCCFGWFQLEIRVVDEKRGNDSVDTSMGS